MLDSLDPATVEALKYASIPVVAAAIGYGTNVLAIQMTFLPLEYLGFGERFFRRFGFSLGWQGIIPANAEKMARKSVQLITKELLTIDQVFSRLEPEAIAIEIGPALLRATELILDEVARVHAPDVWETLPLHVQAELALAATELAPPYIERIMYDLKTRPERYLDLEDFVVEKLTEDPELLNEIFTRCGEAEFRFIERSGFYFGFGLGLLQAAIWFVLRQHDMPLWWFLPVMGALCGYVTNWIAMCAHRDALQPMTAARSHLIPTPGSARADARVRAVSPSRAEPLFPAQIPHLQADRADDRLRLLRGARSLPPPPGRGVRRVLAHGRRARLYRS